MAARTRCGVSTSSEGCGSTDPSVRFVGSEVPTAPAMGSTVEAVLVRGIVVAGTIPTSESNLRTTAKRCLVALPHGIMRITLSCLRNVTVFSSMSRSMVTQSSGPNFSSPLLFCDEGSWNRTPLSCSTHNSG